jgi:Concanavalin A-like lectin/glucanases superfamily
MSLKNALFLGLVVAAVPALYAADAKVKQITWTFDNLSKIGGLPVTVEGSPKVIGSPVGKAIEFDGVHDSLVINQHPLAGAATFTFEAIFRPDGGAEAQRWFHLAERDPKTGQLANVDPKNPTQDTNARFLFELRVVDGDKWYLDAFTNGPGYSRALMFKDKLHPIGRWYHVADVYDGKMFRSYVNGELQGEAELPAFKPQGEGAASIGVRMNKVNYFHGAVARARFTNKALTPAEFMKLPLLKEPKK